MKKKIVSQKKDFSENFHDQILSSPTPTLQGISLLTFANKPHVVNSYRVGLYPIASSQAPRRRGPVTNCSASSITWSSWNVEYVYEWTSAQVWIAGTQVLELAKVHENSLRWSTIQA